MSKNPLPPVAQIERMMATMWSPELRDNPLTFVKYAFPWGVKDTPLEHAKGPKKWQEQELLKIAAFIKENKARIARGEDPKVYRVAISSGRGIGKSTLVSWLALWHLSTKFGAPAIISANNLGQLTTATFAEIGTWAQMAVNHYWFERTQDSIRPRSWLVDALKQRQVDSQYYYVEGKLWDADNPDGFRGPHSPYGMMVIFDEASSIPKVIWDVASMFFTEKGPYMFFVALANPRVNTGQFFDCFHEDRDVWSGIQIDARNVEGVNLTMHHEMVKKYGEDSDKVRIEVRGMFPKQGDRQFISRSVVDDACHRSLERYDDGAPLLMGVDIARFGDDSTVIRFRQGRDARSLPAITMVGADNMEVANRVAHLIDIHNPDGVCIDSGAGSGVIDRLKERGYVVSEVIFGSASEEYADLRTELWAKMRDWIPGAMLPEASSDTQDPNKKLIEDLCGPEYEFTDKGKVKLESKEKMKKRKIPSPDNADALAVTFYGNFPRKDLTASRFGRQKRHLKARGLDYDPFGNN